MNIALTLLWILATCCYLYSFLVSNKNRLIHLLLFMFSGVMAFAAWYDVFHVMQLTTFPYHGDP
jgi:predicted membrane channel-forming protein YqfA (hemolysin III family)